MSDKRMTAEERVRAALGYPDGDLDDCTSFASASMALSIAEEHAAAAVEKAHAEIERLQRTIKSAHDYLPLVTGEPVPLVDYNLVPHVIAVAEGWDELDCDREWYRAQAERMRAVLRKVVQRGHYDTCSHALSAEYDCDCPHAEAARNQ